MITQELIAYVKGELNKGKTREMLRTSLLSGGGWSEQDVSEVFRTVMPMGGSPAKSVSFQTSADSKDIKPLFSLNRDLSPKEVTLKPMTPVTPQITPLPVTMTPRIEAVKINKPTSKYLFPAIAALLFGFILFAVFYFFRPEVMSLNEKGASALDSLSTTVGSWFEKSEQTPPNLVNTPVEPIVPVVPLVKQKVNCGITTSPDRKNKTAYSKDSVLTCLGENAVACNPAEAVINDEFFPNIFRITAQNNSCRFELAYSLTSTLTDVNGKKFAGRSLSCPLSVVKAIDETNPNSPVFRPTDMTNPSRYSTDIYFYGTLGLFIENNFDQQKINSLGCSGEFINSVIESYKLSQSKS